MFLLENEDLEEEEEDEEEEEEETSDEMSESGSLQAMPSRSLMPSSGGEIEEALDVSRVSVGCLAAAAVIGEIDWALLAAVESKIRLFYYYVVFVLLAI